MSYTLKTDPRMVFLNQLSEAQKQLKAGGNPDLKQALDALPIHFRIEFRFPAEWNLEKTSQDTYLDTEGETLNVTFAAASLKALLKTKDIKLSVAVLDA